MSTELLTAVLGYTVFSVTELHGNKENYLELIKPGWSSDSAHRVKSSINIHELANLCKEWAWSTFKYNIVQGISDRGYYSNILTSEILNVESFTATTPSETIFKACQWLLEKDINDNKHN